jgi:predicted enzyme related to lactoylglutathione lyase
VTDTHGRFSWYELLTTDMEGARTFYADVVGWGTQDASARQHATRARHRPSPSAVRRDTTLWCW